MSTRIIHHTTTSSPARVRYTLTELGEALARVAHQQEALGHTPEEAWYRAATWLYVLKQSLEAGVDQAMAEHTADVSLVALNRAQPPARQASHHQGA